MPTGIYIRTKEILEKQNKGKLRGNKHPNWKGGKTIQVGYMCINSPGHPKAYSYKNPYVPEQVIVMEKKLGRYLKEGEYVHHKDGNKLNNKLSNLELIKDGMKEHARLHSQLRKRDKFGRFL